MVRPVHVADLKEALLKLLERHGLGPDLLCSELRELMLIFFHGKRMFPSPQQLRAAGFQHPILEFDLSAGECLIADGGFVHWGVNQDSRTCSLATNVLPEDWLKVRSSRFSFSALAAACTSRGARCVLIGVWIVLAAGVISGGARVHCGSVELGQAAA